MDLNSTRLQETAWIRKGSKTDLTLKRSMKDDKSRISYYFLGEWHHPGKLMQDPRMKRQMELLGITVDDSETLFRLLNRYGDGLVDTLPHHGWTAARAAHLSQIGPSMKCRTLSLKGSEVFDFCQL